MLPPPALKRLCSFCDKVATSDINNELKELACHYGNGWGKSECRVRAFFYPTSNKKKKKREKSGGD